MGRKSPEEGELQQFLAKLPDWKRKAVRDDINSMSREELKEFGEYLAQDSSGSLLDLNRKYQQLARRVPAEWGKYCEIERQHVLADANLPKPVMGRPRKDALSVEARMLKDEGKSYQQIAISLNSKYGSGTTNREAIRKLLKRKTRRTPDKSQP